MVYGPASWLGKGVVASIVVLGGVADGRTTTLQEEEPVPPAKVRVERACGLAPSCDRKMPTSWRVGEPKFTVTSRSRVRLVPPTQELGAPEPGWMEMLVIWTSLAVQPRSSPKRSAAHMSSG